MKCFIAVYYGNERYFLWCICFGNDIGEILDFNVEHHISFWKPTNFLYLCWEFIKQTKVQLPTAIVINITMEMKQKIMDSMVHSENGNAVPPFNIVSCPAEYVSENMVWIGAVDIFIPAIAASFRWKNRKSLFFILP